CALSSSVLLTYLNVFFFSSRRRHTRSTRDWSSDVCSSDLIAIEYKVYREGPLTVLFLHGWGNAASAWDDLVTSTRNVRPDDGSRSEERRVGKECRSGWWRYE